MENMNKIMILKGGSPAIHKLGDISRKCDDKIRIHSEDDTYYIGSFEEGYGLINVKFNKLDCRPLTQIERKKLNGNWYTINGNPLYRIYVDDEGNIINGKVLTIKGVISKVTDSLGNDKHSNFINLEVEFGEDISIGRSVVMLTGEGAITTSRVINFELDNGQYIIYTNNSVYYINVNKGGK